MSDATWTKVDGYITEKLLEKDPVLERTIQSQEESGLPMINVTAPQGRMLGLLVKISGARKVLELGTLGGYSTTWLARALPDGGKVTSLEINRKHADIAMSNLRNAGVSDRVEIKLGDAMKSMQELIDDGSVPFDVIFVDADKDNLSGYLELSLKLSHPGTVIVVDNVVRNGKIVDPENNEASVAGVRNLMEAVSGLVGIESTVIQTVGEKGYDGFMLIRVND